MQRPRILRSQARGYRREHRIEFRIGIRERGRVSPAGGGDAQTLSKITFAPTLTVGKGYWSRPELRAFITHAQWNSAAQAAAAPGSTLSTTGAFGSDTSGTSFGFQVESWW